MLTRRGGSLVCVCVRAKPQYLGWTPGQGSRSMRNDPQKDPLNSHLRLCRPPLEYKCELPVLLADSSQSCPGPRSLHPGAGPALTHALLQRPGSCTETPAQKGKKDGAARALASLYDCRPLSGTSVSDGSVIV